MKETTEHYNRVRRFMRLAGQDTPEAPAEMDQETRDLRARLLIEEALGTITRGLGVEVISDGEVINFDDLCFRTHGPGSAVELLDGCCDVDVITTGTLIAAGLSDAEPQRLVDENNLAKFGPGSYRREDGKWIKPADHQPPDLAAEVARQRDRYDVVKDGAPWVGEHE